MHLCERERLSFCWQPPFPVETENFFEIAASIALIYSLLHRLLQQCVNQFAESENTSTPKIQNLHFQLFQKYKIRIIHTFCSLEMAQQKCLLYGLVNSVKIGIEENNVFFPTDQSFTLSLHALSKFHDSYIGHTLGSPHLLFLMSHCLYARHTPPLSLDINSQQENELFLLFLCSRYEHWPEYGRDKDFISLPQEFATKNRCQLSPCSLRTWAINILALSQLPLSRVY